MRTISSHKNDAVNVLDKREIQYLLENCRDVGDVKLSSNAGEILSHIAGTLKVSTAEDYESIKQLEGCGNPDVIVKLHCNSSFVSFANKPL
ncbi:MAG: hypothetical protein KGH78_00785, partial [Candidatus Micrarchaeota archaeon]|nr:hypothetical protein [Candidatus Micrarchaeota archaeon]